MFKLRGINVVYLYVTDLARSREFYENVLGFGPPIMKSPTWVEYRLGEGSHFALHKTEDEQMALCDPACNTCRFSIVVDDLEDAYRELSAHNIIFTRPPEKGFGFMIAEFDDPDGNPLRLLQYTTMRPVP